MQDRVVPTEAKRPWLLAIVCVLLGAVLLAGGAWLAFRLI